MVKYIVGLVLLIAWIYILYILKKAKLDFFKFLLGSAGMFFFLLFYASNTLISPFSYFVTGISGYIGKLLGIYEVYSKYGVLAIEGKDIVNIYIDFECSGILEIITYISMVMFFPAYQLYEKVIVQVFGTLYILLANVIRLSFIGVATYFLGMEYYYLVHSVIARLIFLVMIMALYFYTFTRKQILKQKVGKFNYV